MSAWVPQEAGVQQLCQLLIEAQQGGGNQVLIHQQLEQYKQYPDYYNYLSFIFATGDGLPLQVRQTAGLLLKNNLKGQFAKLPDTSKQYIKGVLLQLLPHPAKELRQTAGTVLAVLVREDGLAAWPDLLAALLTCLAAGDNPNAVDGGLDTLLKVVEDTPRQVEAQVQLAPGAAAGAAAASGGSQVASMLLVPPLLAQAGSAREASRRGALAVLNAMAPFMPAGIQAHMDAYIQALFSLVQEASPSVRKEVCVGLVQLVGLQPDRLQPHLLQIIEYMLANNEHPDQAVATESCEFWMAFCEAEVDPAALRPYLPRLVPVLMKNMVFEEHDEEVLEAEAAEAAAAGGPGEDREQDLRPVHGGGRRDGAGASAGGGGGGGGGAGGEEEDDDEEDDEDEGVRAWNLRKCSAASVDMLSNVYPHDLLPVLLPIVEQRLGEADWRRRESAILALGAVAAGCAGGLQPYLEGMVAMMVPHLADARPMVRIIACWSLSRYADQLARRWQAAQAQGAQAAPAAQFDGVLSSLIGRMRDPNKAVQVAACSAVATVTEVAVQEAMGPGPLEAHLPALAAAIGQALAVYGRKALRAAYDVLGTLAEAVGGRLADPGLLPAYLPPLLERISRAGLADREAIPALECLMKVVPPLGPAFQPYAPALFQHAMSIVATHMEARQRQEQQQAAGSPGAASSPAAAGAGAGAGGGVVYDPDLVVAALDLLAALAEGLGPQAGALLQGSPLVSWILAFCADADPALRQSGFALVGDLAKAASQQLLPALPDLARLALASLQPATLVRENMSACNNACWCLGELALKVPPEALAPHVLPVAEALAHVVASITRLPRSIVENASITLGRLAWVASPQLAPHFAAFAPPWCVSLRLIRDGLEKEHAFLGLTRLARAAPAALMEPAGFQPFMAALASWRVIGCEGLHNELSQLLGGLKAQLAASGRWQVLWDSLEAPVKGKVQNMYQQAFV